MAAVTVVVGDEEFLVSRAVTAVVEAASSSPDEAPAQDVVATELAPDDLAELASPSLFDDRRVIVVRAAQDASKDLVAALTALAEDGHDDVRLVVVHSGAAKGKALLEALKRAGADVVETPRIKTARDREQFVVDEAKEAGGTIDRDAVVELITAVGTDLRELSIACVQLIADVGRHVTVEDVTAHHRGRAESTGFTVADRAVEGDAAAALETLRWALATGVEPVLVSAALASNLRTIAVVGAAGRGSPDEIAARVGLPAWKVRRAQAWLRRWRPEALADAVTAVADADAAIKGAGDDPGYAAERAVLAVAGCAGG